MFERCLAMLLSLSAQEGEDEDYSPESQQIEQVVEQNDSAGDEERGRSAESNFDSLMQKNAALQARPQGGAQPAMAELMPPAAPPPVAASGEVKLPLGDFRSIRSTINKQRETKPAAPPVVLGAAEYRGRGMGGALSLAMTLDVTLGAPGQWKTVPLIGEDVVLIAARRDGKPIATSKERGYQVWVTPEAGEVRLELELLVPSRGPRGSIEFDFLAPRTPVTRFECSFPVAGLEPRIDAAVHSELRAEGGGTHLSAALRPTARVHLVGFKDLGEGEGTKAKVYAESLNLLSIDEGALELFTVVRYSILYGGTKDFQLAIPAGFNVVSADGEGAFRYVLDRGEQGTVLRGETAFPIRNHFEISLRLRRDLSKAKTEEHFDAPLPRSMGAEREQGWLAIEVPGKLKLEEESRDEVLPIDVRQLPPEMIESAVSPLLKAYRYHSAKAKVALAAVRLPEKDPSSASIDRVRAHSVVSSEGRLLTDLKITLRNRLRPSLSLDLPEGAVIRSTLLDGDPVKPSKDEAGHLMLPLKRSRGGERLEPFTVEVVLEAEIDPLGWFGVASLALPAFDLPISSLAWSVDLPSHNSYGGLKGEAAGQTYAGHGVWNPPPSREQGGASFHHAGPGAPQESSRASAETGAMPVRIELPQGGVSLEHARYWIEAGRPVRVWTSYLRGWLAAPLGVLLALLCALAAFVAARIGASRGARLGGIATALVASWPLSSLASGTIAVLAIGIAVIAARWGAIAAALQSTLGWIRALPQRWRERPTAVKLAPLAILWKLGVGFWMIVFVCLTTSAALHLLWILAHPY